VAVEAYTGAGSASRCWDRYEQLCRRLPKAPANPTGLGPIALGFEEGSLGPES
jgi:hypothetical protein